MPSHLNGSIREDRPPLHDMRAAVVTAPPGPDPDPGALGRTGLPRPRTYLMGVPIDSLTEEGAIDHILAGLRDGRGGWVVTPNVDILRQIVHDPDLHRTVEGATLMLVDGAPLVWASRLKGEALPERIPGATFVWSLSRAAAASGASIFLLGAGPGVAERAGSVLQRAIPGIQIRGHLSPPFGFESSPEQMQMIVESIAAAQPDVVFCGLGCPKQERLMSSLAARFPDVWFLACGGTFDFIAGDTRRAPHWMQRSGLEWFHRLVHEPRRLFGRYVVHDIPFAVSLLAHAVMTRRAAMQRTGRPEAWKTGERGLLGES